MLRAALCGRATARRLALPVRCHGTATAPNPLLVACELPAFDAIRAAHVEPAIKKLVSSLRSDLASFASSIESGAKAPSWEAVLELEAIKNPLAQAWGAVNHLLGVANSAELRAAHAAALPEVIAVTSEIDQHPVLYNRLYKAVAQAHAATAGGVTPGQRRTVQLALRQAELAGVGLPVAAQEAFNKLLLRSSELAQRFDNNLIDSTGTFAMTLTTSGEVEGLPASVRQQYAEAAARRGHPGAAADSGPWLVTLDMASFRPFMQFAARRDLREQLYRAHITRASTGAHDNGPVMAEQLAVRHEMARALGYPDHAAVSLASKMAGTVADVNALLQGVRDRVYPHAQAEMAALAQFARDRGHPAAADTGIVSVPGVVASTSAAGGAGIGVGGLMHWDTAYWSERQLQEVHGLDEEELKAYFPLPAVLRGMFQTINDAFGVRVQERARGTGGAAALAGGGAGGGALPFPPVWDDSVQFFDIVEGGGDSSDASAPGGGRIASFYLDPFSRPATKRGGAWADVCVGRTTNPALLTHGGPGPSGSARLPVAYLVCNQTPPLGGSPSLMRHTDTLTLWHEVGHGLQHMLTRVGEADVAGLSGVEWDAVELPSQFMEEFAYHPGVLKRMSAYTPPPGATGGGPAPGSPVPDALIAKLRGSRRHMAASGLLRQLYFAKTDILLHSAEARTQFGGSGSGTGSACGFDPLAVQRHVAATHSLLQPLPVDRFLCGFSHIFSGGYAAGYYSYLHALVMATDAFGAFEEAGFTPTAPAEALAAPGLREVGRRFRETVLGLGGSVHPADVYTQFRGRPPRIDALLGRYGLGA